MAFASMPLGAPRLLDAILRNLRDISRNGKSLPRRKRSVMMISACHGAGECGLALGRRGTWLSVQIGYVQTQGTW